MQTLPLAGLGFAGDCALSKAKVYVLIDPITKLQRYVGQTRCRPQKRLKFHYKELNKHLNQGKRLSPVKLWLKNLRDKNLRPEIEILDSKAIWDISEAVWIDRLTNQGVILLNVASRVT